MITAARDQLAERGVAKVSLRAIARDVGVSHQAATHHFGDRAGLFTALAAEGFADLFTHVSAAYDDVDASAPASDRVGAIGASYVRFAEQMPSVFDVMFRPELVHPEDPVLLKAQAEVWRRLFDAVAEAREEGWGGDVPTQTLTILCWSSVHGLATLRRDSRMVELAGGLSVEGLVSLMAAAIAAAPSAR